jgi:hypothetical protein
MMTKCITPLDFVTQYHYYELENYVDRRIQEKEDEE